MISIKDNYLFIDDIVSIITKDLCYLDAKNLYEEEIIKFLYICFRRKQHFLVKKNLMQVHLFLDNTA